MKDKEQKSHTPKEKQDRNRDTEILHQLETAQQAKKDKEFIEYMGGDLSKIPPWDLGRHRIEFDNRKATQAENKMKRERLEELKIVFDAKKAVRRRK